MTAWPCNDSWQIEKTAAAAVLIARRKVSTLVLVHRTELLRQWQERLTGFLEFPKGGLGVIGGGRKKPSGKIDIAVMQSLSRREDLGELLDHYGQIIVDECHHLSAFSFEAILKQAKSRYMVGLTATPIRRDGHQPIIFMQCGPIRHHFLIFHSSNRFVSWLWMYSLRNRLTVHFRRNNLEN